jgi:hypothetical protein
MFASSLSGATLRWHPLDDPIGAWGLSLDGELIAEFSWSREPPGVHVEIGPELWHLGFVGTLVIRGVETRAGSTTPQLLYAGNLREGLALCREGKNFKLISHLDPRVGQWTGFDDTDGNGVVRVQGRSGGGGIWSEVSVRPGNAHREFIERLLILWGGLQILRQQRPWLSLTASIATSAAARRELQRLTEDATS